MDKIPVLSYVYLLSILLAFLSSLISFRLDLAFHWKVFAILLGITFQIEVNAAILAYIQGRPTAMLYNNFILIEFLVYAYIFRSLLAGKRWKYLFYAFFLLYPIFWLFTTFFIFGITKWNSYAILLGSFFTIICCLLLYYKLLVSIETGPLLLKPELWFATALLLGYLINLPYFGSLNFLNDSYRNVAKALSPLLRYLNIGMYLTLSFIFLCQIRNTTKSSFRS